MGGNEKEHKIRKQSIADFITLVGLGVGLVFGFRAYGDIEGLVEAESKLRAEADGAIISRIGEIEKWRLDHSEVSGREIQNIRNNTERIQRLEALVERLFYGRR